PSPGSAARERRADLPPVLRGLEVELLRRAILDPILGVDAGALDFTHDDEEAVAAVASGRATVAFLVNAPTIAQMRDVCLAGEVMPEKSTYFHPKIASRLLAGRAAVGEMTGAWPALPLAEWRDTYATFHMWTQIVGKIRMALTPAVNHWWHVVLYVTPRGLTTSPIPYGDRHFAIDFDLV